MQDDMLQLNVVTAVGRGPTRRSCGALNYLLCYYHGSMDTAAWRQTLANWVTHQLSCRTPRTSGAVVPAR